MTWSTFPTTVAQLLPWLLAAAGLVLAAILSRRASSRLHEAQAARLTALETRNRELEALAATVPAQRERVVALRAELAQERARHATLQERHAQLGAEYAALEARTAEQARAHAAQLRLLEDSETRLQREFERLAQRIFEDKQRVFSAHSTAGMTAVLNPLREQLGEFRRKIEDIYDSENRDRASLRTEILALKSLNERIGIDALNLTRALKGDSKIRGNWGEMQLERLLEQSGLVAGREYDIQASHANDDGLRRQPDVIVHLPEGRDVVIDAKVSLVAYERFHACADDAREQLANQHVAALRAHIHGLAGKRYDSLIGVNSLELVILFVPIEPALLLALEYQPGLLDEAFRQRVLLVGPSTLMGTLQIIHNIWRHERQNRNALEIATEAGKLHDGFVNFVTGLDRAADALNRARDELDGARKRLVSGRGNLVQRTRHLQELGARTRKNLPDAPLDDTAETVPAGD